MEAIKLNLNTFQEAILQKECKSEGANIKLTRENSIGKFICSQVQWSKEEVKQPDEGITLLLPKYTYIFQQNFYPFISKQNQKNISDFLQSVFDLNLDLFFAKGYRYKYRQKDIVEAFMLHYNLPQTVTIVDMLKKRDYRKKVNVRKIIAKSLAEY